MTDPAAAAGRELSFARLSARTQRFTLGQPRGITVADDGSRVAFLRSSGPTDAVTALWVYDVAAGAERLVADPRRLLVGDLAGDEKDLPAEERARRERTREGAGGIVAYATDRTAATAAFALSGRLFVADLADPAGGVRELPAAGPVVDPRPDPSGRRIGYVSKGALRVIDRAGAERPIVVPDAPGVTFGLAEFIAAEEMGRLRGYWWSPDGRRLLAARVDNGPVARWHIADPANPHGAPQEIAYPAAGMANAEVRLAVFTLDGACADVAWDARAFPYLVTASWREHGPLTVLVQSRDQRRMRVLAVDPGTGAATVVREDVDPTWLEIVPGVPRWLADGRLVWVADRAGARGLVLGDEPVTSPTLQVDSVLHVGADAVLIEASAEPTERHVYRVDAAGGLERLTHEPGVHSAVAGGDVVVVSSATLDTSGTVAAVQVAGRERARLVSHAARPPIQPRVDLVVAGSRQVRTAVLFPRPEVRRPGPLPVLMDPYGGPHAQRVLKACATFLSAQWFADQGFAVVVADGRGTPGRGPLWERAVHLDLATPALDDQVAALETVAARYAGEIDISRVGIRGWSFGGYLAALAVLRRPDVFHAGVAGAPVTDWRLYDTHYTERYLGRPDEQPQAYERSSLLADAARLSRPLMLIHGLADDNVVAAHTLRLSSALLTAGRPHTVLPLSGVTHMTPQEVVAENLLLLQVAFLRDALGVSA